MPNNLYRIVYISHSTINDKELAAQLENIQQGSSTRNAKQKISGQLIYCEHLFIQTLEGQSDALNSLIETIKQDKRHTGFKVIFSGKVCERDHPDWSQMQVITDTTKLAQFKKYIESIAALPQNTMAASQTKDILYLLSSFNQTQ